jgi:hypothetical protein
MINNNSVGIGSNMAEILPDICQIQDKSITIQLDII